MMWFSRYLGISFSVQIILTLTPKRSIRLGDQQNTVWYFFSMKFFK